MNMVSLINLLSQVYCFETGFHKRIISNFKLFTNIDENIIKYN